MAFAASAAHAADAYPTKPIRWIVPYAAGGGSDFLARTIGQGLSAASASRWWWTTSPAATPRSARRKPRAADGYTVLSADNGTLVFNPVLYKTLSYNPTRDLAPVTLMGRFPMILVVGPGSRPRPRRNSSHRSRPRPAASTMVRPARAARTIWRWNCSRWKRT
jgi:tripartite-type tricarboxylate transporter receptor subunit TctC